MAHITRLALTITGALALLLAAGAQAVPVTVNFSVEYEVDFRHLAGTPGVPDNLYTLTGTLFTVDSADIGAPIDLSTRLPIVGSITNGTQSADWGLTCCPTGGATFEFTSTDLAALAGTIRSPGQLGLGDLWGFFGLIEPFPGSSSLALLFDNAETFLSLDGFFGGFQSQQTVLSFSYVVGSSCGQPGSPPCDVSLPGSLSLLLLGALGLAVARRGARGA